jgi:hypothetical protein
MAVHEATPESEHALARALVGLPSPWCALDVPGPDVRGLRTTLVVGPPGAYVVRPAHAPRGRALDRLLVAISGAATEIARTTELHREEVHAVLCVTGEEYVDAWRHGVALCSPEALADHLQHRRHWLDDAEVAEVTRRLERVFAVGGRHRRGRVGI